MSPILSSGEITPEQRRDSLLREQAALDHGKSVEQLRGGNVAYMHFQNGVAAEVKRLFSDVHFSVGSLSFDRDGGHLVLAIDPIFAPLARQKLAGIYIEDLPESHSLSSCGQVEQTIHRELPDVLLTMSFADNHPTVSIQGEYVHT